MTDDWDREERLHDRDRRRAARQRARALRREAEALRRQARRKDWEPPPPAPPAGSAAPAAPPAASSRTRRRRARTPEERAWREARAAVNRKMGFLSHAVPYAAVCVFLLLVAGLRPASIVAFWWGIGLTCHWFFALHAPRMRERMIRDEVEHRVHADVSQERRSLEGEHARRLERLSASIAHEIRNPITAAKSLVQQMGEDPGSSENVEYAKVALDELGRVERSISHLLRFAREEELSTRELRPQTVVDSALDALRERLERLQVRVDCDLDEAGLFRGDPEALRRVLLNLVGNALDAFEEHDTPDASLRIEAGENLASTEVWLRIRDNGPGMEPERAARAFDPFYTSRGAGTGLGLPICKKLVEAHGGRIELESREGRGTEFLLSFPKDGRDAAEGLGEEPS